MVLKLSLYAVKFSLYGVTHKEFVRLRISCNCRGQQINRLATQRTPYFAVNLRISCKFRHGFTHNVQFFFQAVFAFITQGETSTGTLLFVVPPLPSWPFRPRPQHFGPLAVMAQVWLTPIETSETAEGSSTKVAMER